MSNIRITQEVVLVIVTVAPNSFPVTPPGNPPPGNGNPQPGQIGSTGCIEIPLIY